MCCIRGICILAPGANVSANPIFHPVQVLEGKGKICDGASVEVNYGGVMYQAVTVFLNFMVCNILISVWFTNIS